MVDQPLFENVKDLLDHGFGDDRILKQIFRACQRDEVVSNYERNYVKRLAEMYLRKKPEPISHVAPNNDNIVPSLSSSTPDVILPSTHRTLEIRPLQKSSSRSFFSSKRNKILLGLGIIVLLIIIAAVATFVYFAGLISTGDGTGIVTPITSPPPVPVSDTTSVQTDSSLYGYKDLISISGTSDSSASEIVNLTITNQDSVVVWEEQLSIKANGTFSTLTIAGGAGWENSDIYTLTAVIGAETISTTFSFTR